jgi:23S rRNA pseudouridine1911/1915/1917 synthase
VNERRIVDVVPDGLAGERLDRLVALITGESRAHSTSLVESGAVTLGGRVVTKPAIRLTPGQEIVIVVPASVVQEVSSEPAVPYTVVYSDDDVIVVDKPVGLVVHPGAGQSSGTLSQALVARFPELASVGDPERPGIVHRLDKSTSGLLVVARTAEAYDDLVEQLASRTVHREYLALVVGHPPASGVIDAPIGRSQKEPTRMALSPRGRDAITHYETIEKFDHPEPLALVACRLETGRTHQIRVHMSAIGHPVVGDDRYGGVRRDVPVGRPLLHARSLGFDHPVTGEPMEFDSVIAADFAEVLDRLRSARP